MIEQLRLASREYGLSRAVDDVVGAKQNPNSNVSIQRSGIVRIAEIVANQPGALQDLRTSQSVTQDAIDDRARK